MRILVVEDDPLLAAGLERVLSRWGHAVDRAATGIQADNLLRTTVYELVVLDIGLPDIDGFEVLRPSVDGFHQPKAHRYRKGEYSAIGYYEDAFDCAAVVSHVLQPLSGSRFPVVCRRASHDVRTD